MPGTRWPATVGPHPLPDHRWPPRPVGRPEGRSGGAAHSGGSARAPVGRKVRRDDPLGVRHGANPCGHLADTEEIDGQVGDWHAATPGQGRMELGA